MNKIKQPILKFLLFTVPMGTILIFIITPFVWAISTSLKKESDVLKVPIQYIPNPLTFENYVAVWKQNNFSLYFFNSMLIAVVSVGIILVLSIMNGYAISRYKFKGKNAFMIILLCTQMLPVVMLLIPLFLTFKTIGIINSPLSLIIVYVTLQLPFNTLLMKGFISGIPKQVDEAAMIDGASKLRLIATVIMPVLLPGIIATSAFAFIGCWNEFMTAYVFTTSKNMFTIPVGLKFLIGEFDIYYASLAAGSIIALIPPVILFAYIQKFLIQGLSSGAVKG